jgi:16S rRNA (cytosine1402-N4)-methyltransferase
MMTEARAHETVLLEEAVSAVLGPLNGVYMDGTFGRGGHSRLLLSELGPEALLIGVDKDPVAVSVGQKLAESDARFEIEHASFTHVDEFLSKRSLPGFNGILVDLGVSSPQIDDAMRGFSFMNDGPLDMRMDPTSGQSAAQWINAVPEKQLVTVLKEYGEERFAKKIAAAIVSERTKKPFETTAHLASVVSEANPAWEKHKHPATRVFQAIRIQINNELGDLAEFLVNASNALVVGGRLVVISFHSLEDRMVKRFMKGLAKGDEPPPGVPVFDKDIARHFKLLSKAIKPSEQEVENNPRARSAVMRILEKVSDA